MSGKSAGKTRAKDGHSKRIIIKRARNSLEHPDEQMSSTLTEPSRPSGSHPTMDSSGTVASEVGLIMASGKAVIDQRLPDASDAFPIIALTQDEEYDAGRWLLEFYFNDFWLCHQQREKIIAFCREDNSQFVDDRFPPTPASLAVCQAPPKFTRIQAWLRPSQLLLSSADVEEWTVCGIPLASDIQQGMLGDCWFLCSLSVVAQRPELIYNVLFTRAYSKEGVYVIRLCIDGLWKMILVDDLFPADDNWNLVFSQAGRQQLWVPLIEKALAKAHGSYYSLTAGSISEGLMFLTGAPCESFSLDATTPEEYDSLWQRLLSSQKSQFLMGASCGKVYESVTEEYDAVGLRSRHAYSLLDVADAGGHRLVQLRNPWGCHGWTGDWSDGSEVWTAALREQLRPDGDADGLFWMSLQDFVKYFSWVDVAKYRDQWKDIRVQGTFPNCASHTKWSVWMITVTETTEVDLTLYQQGYRGGSREMNHHHLDMAVLIFSITPDRNTIKLVAASTRTVSPFVCESTLLEPGQYIVRELVLNQLSISHSLYWQCWTLAFNHFLDMVLPEEIFPRNVLAIHSDKSVVIERFHAAPYALADAVILWAMNKGTRWCPETLQYVEGEAVLDPVVYFISAKGLIMVYENRYRNHNVQVMLDCSTSRDMVSTRGTLVTVDVIPPLSRCVICVLSPSHGGTCCPDCAIYERVSDAGDDGLGNWGPAGVAHHPEIATDVLRDLHSPRPM